MIIPLLLFLNLLTLAMRNSIRILIKGVITYYECSEAVLIIIADVGDHLVDSLAVPSTKTVTVTVTSTPRAHQRFRCQGSGCPCPLARVFGCFSCFWFSGHGFIPPVCPRSPRLRLQVVAIFPRAIGEERFTEPRPSPTVHRLTGSQLLEHVDAYMPLRRFPKPLKVTQITRKTKN